MCRGGPVTNFALHVDCVGMHRSLPPLCRKASALASQGMLPDMPLCLPAHKCPLFCSCQLIPALFTYSLAGFLACGEPGSRCCCFHLQHRQTMWGETTAQWELLLLLPPLPGPSPENPPSPAGIGVCMQPETAAGPQEKLDLSLQPDRTSSTSRLIPLYFLNETRDKTAMC